LTKIVKRAAMLKSMKGVVSRLGKRERMMKNESLEGIIL
jgi:hypothetical protein